MSKHKIISEQIRAGQRPQGAELTEADVGVLLSWLEGFGPVQRGDVGKRVWLKPYGLVMENNEQRDRRRGAPPPRADLPGELDAEPPVRCPYCGAYVDPVAGCPRSRCCLARACARDAALRPNVEIWQRVAREAARMARELRDA